MRKLEVVTYDLGTGLAEVDHTWKVRQRGKRKVTKLVKRAKRWAHKAAKADKSTDHVVYLRGV